MSPATLLSVHTGRAAPLGPDGVPSAFIKQARKQLLIYDPKIADRQIMRLLEDHARAGLDIKIIGSIAARSSNLPVAPLTSMRLHTRTIIRDGREAFVGSQSLRQPELDLRREIGIVFHDAHIASVIAKTFDADWNLPALPAGQAEDPLPTDKIAKKVAKAVTKALPAIAPVVEVVVHEVAGNGVDVDLNPERLQDTVKTAVKNAVKEAVRGVVEEVVEQDGRAQ